MFIEGFKILELAIIAFLIIAVPIIIRKLTIDKKKTSKFPGKIGINLPREYRRRHILK